jgi:transposase
MTNYSALDLSLEATAICVVDRDGRIIAEKKVPTCPDAIASWLANTVPDLGRVGMETALWPHLPVYVGQGGRHLAVSR